MIKLSLPGTYGTKQIELHITHAEADVNAVTLFVHGLYGTTAKSDNGDLSQAFARELVKHGLSNVVHYNSSRAFHFDTDTPFRIRQAAFDGKTFEQELQDLRTVVSFLTNRPDLLGTSRGNIRLQIHGTSLGGTFALLLEEFFPLIQRISLCGSGCGTNGSRKPILSTMYAEEIILTAVSKYTGNLLLIQGSFDTVVPQESGLKILSRATRARTEHLLVSGGNHTLTTRYGRVDDTAIAEAVAHLIDWSSRGPTSQSVATA